MATNNDEHLHALLIMPNTKCFLLEGTNKNLIGEGTLNVMFTNENSLFFHIPELFEYIISKQIPSMKASDHSFVFPLIDKQCWGLVFSENTPPEDLKIFEDLLAQSSQFEILQEQQINPSIIEQQQQQQSNGIQSSIKTSGEGELEQKQEQPVQQPQQDKIVQMGQNISNYIDKGSILIQKGIQNGTSILIHHINKTKEDIKLKINIREERAISEQTKTRINYAKSASKTAVTISSFVYGKAKGGYNRLSQMIINLASNSNSLKYIKDNHKSTFDVTKQISKSTLLSIIILHETLETSALSLINELSKASVDLSEYKYGKQVGQEAENISNIIMNSAKTYKNVNRITFGIHPIAKSIAGNLAIEEIPNNVNNNDNVLQSSTYQQPQAQ